MSVRTIALTALLAGLAITPVAGEEFNPVIGKSGELTLREADLERLMASQPPEVRKQLEEKPELKVGLVRELLLKATIARQARKEGFDRKPEIREQLAYVVDDFLSREYLTKVVIAGVNVPEEELSRYFKEHEKEFIVPSAVKARHIFIKLATSASAEERDKARNKAEELRQRLKKGEDFAALATKASEDEDTAKNGGDLGRILAGKTNSADFETALFSLKAGEISEVVTTPFGLHIIKVDERQEQHTATFAETRDYIAGLLKKELEQKKAMEFMEKIAAQNGLEVNGDKISGTQPVNGGKP
jgi:peptidyl-prolyl cis-trans isomerase C